VKSSAAHAELAAMIAPSSPKICPATATSTMATTGQIQIDA
jgi:hypothetical protein